MSPNWRLQICNHHSIRWFKCKRQKCCCKTAYTLKYCHQTAYPPKWCCETGPPKMMSQDCIPFKMMSQDCTPPIDDVKRPWGILFYTFVPIYGPKVLIAYALGAGHFLVFEKLALNGLRNGPAVRYSTFQNRSSRSSPGTPIYWYLMK